MTFTYERAADDLSPLADAGTQALAGGTDLLPLHKLGLTDPDRLLDLKTSGLPATIVPADGGWRIGALATLADVEDHGGLRAAVPMVALAVERAATRQIRNRATVGGNLLQEPRCRYFRSEDLTCWYQGDEDCLARDGRNEHHAIFQTSPCVAVQPSDLASALVCTGALVELEGGRDVPVAELLAPPTDEHRSLHRLPAGAAIRSVRIPIQDRRRSTYRKAMDRAAWQFALAGVAASVAVGDDGTVDDASLVASGVAAVPWRLAASEAALTGRRLDDEAIADASAAAAEGAEPLSENGYKAALLRGLVGRALDDLR
ncbi:MAG: FAD binding domain-containing protein [Acidimicrobiia bacterium]